MKKYLSSMILILALFNLAPIFQQQVYAQNEITVNYNGKQLEFDAKPYVKQGKTLVPFRKILEAFGAEISWDKEEQIITAKKNTTEIYLRIGIQYGYVNGSKVSLDVPPEISGGRTFVPLRFISENLGAEVKWNGLNKTASIEYVNHTYKLGQEGTYKGLKFKIDKLDTTSESGVLMITGKVSSGNKDMVLEVADDYGYVLPAEIDIKGQSGEMDHWQAKVYLPGCHNFIGKYLVLKKPNVENKLIKIGQYEL
ncbi:MAG: copper amine oxidase N-terminal domain-containing protein [Clostridia bacterium]|nr:copper amine oxidase N-terminal domain-containing protein [Clostridia bacterium]